MQQGVGVYKSPKYTAYFYPKNIVICTRLQCFRIGYTNRSSHTYLEDLTIRIIQGKVNDISELRTYNGELNWNNCYQPSLSQLELAL